MFSPQFDGRKQELHPGRNETENAQEVRMGNETA